MFARKDGDAGAAEVGKMIISEDDLKFQVTYNGEVFTMRHLAPYERLEVENEIVRRLGGYNRNAHKASYVALVEATTYVQASLVANESPAWFKNVWTCYDENCIVELYRGWLDFSSRFQNRFASGISKESGKRDKP